MEERTEYIRHLLSHVPHIAIATVSDDGSPLNTPVFGAFNAMLHAFWSSSPDAAHSRNIESSGRAFLVVFDSVRGGQGLYVAARAERLRDEEQIERAYSLLTEVKARLGAPMAPLASYGPQGPQRLYRAIPEKIWVNQSIKSDAGAVIGDKRIVISINDMN